MSGKSWYENLMQIELLVGFNQYEQFKPSKSVTQYLSTNFRMGTRSQGLLQNDLQIHVTKTFCGPKILPFFL